MILVDISDLDLKAYSQKLSYMTYDFNLDNDLDIMKGWSYMAQLNEETGTKKDLVLYRIQSAKSDLKSAKILLDAE